MSLCVSRILKCLVIFSSFFQNLFLTELVYDIDPKDYVLKPTSFALIIKRNLSSGWFKDHPQVEITGRLYSIELNIIAQDYKVMMQILEKNMSEGQNEFKKPRKPRAVATPTESTRGENIEPFVKNFLCQTLREIPPLVTN